MKATVNKTAICKALSDLSGAISSRTTLPILGNVKLAIKGDLLELEATDLDLYVRSQIPVEESTDGETTLPAKRLLQLLREIPTETARIEVVSNVATVNSGGSRFKLHGLPSDEFPAMGNDGSGLSFTLSGHELCGALRRTCYATSTDESRYVLNGVLFEDTGECLKAVGTDGRRLAVVELPEVNGLQFTERQSAIIPNKAVSMLLRSLDGAEIVTVTVADSWAEFDAAGLTIQTKLIDGNFPHWRQVMPGTPKTTVSVSREDLLASVRRVGMMANEKTNAIVLEFSDGILELSANSPDVGEARESIDYHGNASVKIAINPTFLQQCLSSLSCESVRIALIDETSPMTINDTSFTYVLMPMRLA